MTVRNSVPLGASIGLNNVVNGRQKPVAPSRYSTLSPSAFKYQQMLAEAHREQASSMLR